MTNEYFTQDVKKMFFSRKVYALSEILNRPQVFDLISSYEYSFNSFSYTTFSTGGSLSVQNNYTPL